MRGTEPGNRSQKRQCLTCKNKGCIGRCRFAKSTSTIGETRVVRHAGHVFGHPEEYRAMGKAATTAMKYVLDPEQIVSDMHEAYIGSISMAPPMAVS
jgi:hypothetical protein